MLSVLIPAFNEEHSIERTVRGVHETLTGCGMDFEIVVIDDGSADQTRTVLERLALPQLVVLRHTRNRGYSASLKNGIRHSKGEIIGITDADGTYPLKDFPKLLDVMKETEADMVVGARTKQGAQIPLIRRPAKAILALLARMLTGISIPDLNSGMRIFTRPLAERFMPLYPQGFSFTITITLAALTNDYIVEYVPIEYFKRTGKSSLSAGFNGIKNFLSFFSIILRMVTNFRPLRFFIWPACLLLGSGLILTAYTVVTQGNISDSGLLLLVTGVQVFLFGLLAETVVRSRSLS